MLGRSPGGLEPLRSEVRGILLADICRLPKCPNCWDNMDRCGIDRKRNRPQSSYGADLTRRETTLWPHTILTELTFTTNLALHLVGRPKQSPATQKIGGGRAPRSPSREAEQTSSGYHQGGAPDCSHPRPDHETISWLLRNEFAVNPEVAAAALNVSRNTGYAAIHKGDIPATRVGNRLMVPTAYLRQQLHLEPPLAPAVSQKPAPRSAAHLTKQETSNPRRNSAVVADARAGQPFKGAEST